MSENIKEETLKNTINNTKDIELLTKLLTKLTDNVDKIAESMRVDNKSQDLAISKLISYNEKCDQRYLNLVEKLEAKANRIDRLEREMDLKVGKSALSALVTKLWAIGAFIVAGMVSTIGYLLTHNVKI